MKKYIVITILAIFSLAGCNNDKATQQATVSKQLRDGGNIVTSPPKNLTWDDEPSPSEEKSSGKRTGQ